jgi:calcium-translocating P-type ATPase
MTIEAPPAARAAPALDPEERLDLLLSDLGTRRDGLSAREAGRRLEQHGPNELQRRESSGHLREIVRQLTHPLALLLWAAMALAFIAGLVPIAIAIVVVILLNAAFAFVQELQAERATEALQAYLAPRARVRRDAQEQEIDAAALVPGDVMLLAEGDRLSADARLIEGALEVDMAALTGESEPVTRMATSSRPSPSPLDSDDLVFSGSLVTGGDAEAVVYATGMATQLGRIAALTQRVREVASPLQVQVDRAARLIAVIAFAAGGAFLVAGVTIAGLPTSDALNFGIGLLVGNVPEGLLPTITLALAVGVRRMARRRALVKRLTAVEALGSTDVICTDKTGTLTEGRMATERLWTPGGELLVADGLTPEQVAPFADLLLVAQRCATAHVSRNGDGWEATGDPGEAALLIAAARLGAEVAPVQRRALHHFDPRRKRMATVDDENDGAWVHVKGAPVELLARCSRLRTAAGDAELDERSRRDVTAAVERYAAQGLRVLGFAVRRAAPADVEDRERAESELTFVGLAALLDPPRPDVPGAVARCRDAGIRIIVVTGDHALTASAIARRVGAYDGDPYVITGPELDVLPDADLDALLATERELLVARSSPEAKLRIVDALRAQGHTVAMTGDGVNDAPALRRADIGVAMGATGTDVAREAATMVLTDDSFASIVAAVEEGRLVYDNIRKFVTYIFAHATPEVVPFLLYAAAGGAIPLPITALQILAIDLGTETLPALALGREPPEPGLMDRPPRKRDRGILDRPMLVRAWGWLGLLEAALVTAGFFWVLHRGGWAPDAATGEGAALHGTWMLATTMTFAGITACQVGTAFAARTSHASLRAIGWASNRLLLWGIAFELAFAAAVIYLPPLQAAFGTAALGWEELAVLATFPVLVWGSDELRRWVVRRRGRA